jgi:hypothetical protein
VQAHPSEDLQAIETLWDAAFLPKKSGVGFPKTSSGKRSGCRIANLASCLPIKPAPKVQKIRFEYKQLGEFRDLNAAKQPSEHIPGFQYRATAGKVVRRWHTWAWDPATGATSESQERVAAYPFTL